MLTAKQIEEIRERADLVSNRIGKLASGKERFKMCIPPQPYDDDIAIATLARTDVPALLAEVELQSRVVEAARWCVEVADAWNAQDEEAIDITTEGYFELERICREARYDLIEALMVLDVDLQTVEARVEGK
jgi:hypothetical protein